MSTKRLTRFYLAFGALLLAGAAWFIVDAMRASGGDSIASLIVGIAALGGAIGIGYGLFLQHRQSRT